MKKKYSIGIDVGGTKCAYGLFDSAGQAVEKFRRPSDASLAPAAFFDGMAGEIRALLARRQLAVEDIDGVGIGFPSFIVFDTGHIVKTTNLTNIKDFAARSYLQERFGNALRFVLDNDAHTAALAESRYGAGRGFPHMLYCPVSTGISSAIVINGQLFRGSYGFAGESGHMIITPHEGVLCGCENRGCLMSYTSGSMIVKHVQQQIDHGLKTALTDLAGDAAQIACPHIAQAYDGGDQVAINAIDQMAYYMAVWLFNLYVTLNINCFVFGGGLLCLGDRLFPKVREQFDAYNKNDFPVYFKTAELSDDCGIIGARELLYEGA